MSDTLVCPDCGHDTFTVTRTTRTEYTVQWDQSAGEFELSSEVVDGGDAGDENDWTCGDCGAEYPDCRPDDDLTTAEAYNADSTDDLLDPEGSGYLPEPPWDALDGERPAVDSPAEIG